MKPTRDRKQVQFKGNIGNSSPPHAASSKIAVVAKSDAIVLMRGGSAIGKS
ncbi:MULTISPECIES: hypothetical protein [unclassified Bradyrhizobium]